MPNELLQLEAIIRSVKTLVDGGLSLTVNTQELKPEDSTKLFELKGKFGFMVFKPTRVSEEEMAQVPDEVKGLDDEKSPSQRLRSRMYVYYQNKHKTSKGFADWYRTSLEEIGLKYLERVNE